MKSISSILIASPLSRLVEETNAAAYYRYMYRYRITIDEYILLLIFIVACINTPHCTVLYCTDIMTLENGLTNTSTRLNFDIISYERG
jgi:hypothetical protein